jgi:hypothetical protein
MKKNNFLLGIILTFLAGCMTTQASMPGQTMVDSSGQQAILEQIQWLEKANGRSSCECHVINTTFVEQEMRTRIEHWLVENCGVTTTYKIRITQLSPGTMKYAVTYPKPADLNGVPRASP